MNPKSEKILLAGPSGLLWSTEKPVNLFQFSFSTVYEEYISILKGLARITGRAGVVIGYNYISYTTDTELRKKYHYNFQSNVAELDSNLLTESGKRWPRDAYLFLPDYGLYVRKENFDARYANNIEAIVSKLGEGGKSIVSDDHMLVSQDLFSSPDIEKLLSLGCMIGALPIIDKKKQKYGYCGDDDDKSCHIDGHAALVRTKTDDHHMLVAKSYFEQDPETSKRIIAATESAEVDYTIVDDSRLPPLSFNLLQFADNQVLMTSQADALHKVLSNLVGSEYIQETYTPLYQIPEMSRGSIRCLTNTIPSYLEKYFTTKDGRRN